MCNIIGYCHHSELYEYLDYVCNLTLSLVCPTFFGMGVRIFKNSHCTRYFAQNRPKIDF